MKNMLGIFFSSNEDGHAMLEASVILGFVAVAVVVALYVFAAPEAALPSAASLAL